MSNDKRESFMSVVRLRLLAVGFEHYIKLLSIYINMYMIKNYTIAGKKLKIN